MIEVRNAWGALAGVLSLIGLYLVVSNISALGRAAGAMMQQGVPVIRALQGRR